MRNSNGGPSFHGQIDEVRIWSKALSKDEIQARMSKAIESSDTLWGDLQGYYRMDWGNGTKAYDYSSNLNHGTLTNGPEWVESHSWDKGLFAYYKFNGNSRDSLEGLMVDLMRLNFQLMNG